MDLRRKALVFVEKQGRNFSEEIEMKTNQVKHLGVGWDINVKVVSLGGDQKVDLSFNVSNSTIL